MSADLPETHRSSYAMARCLTSYMDCPYAVQRRIREDFDNYPGIDTIREMRQRHLTGGGRQRNIEPYKAYEGYYPSDVSKAMDGRNAAFLGLLRNAYPERFAA
jgi:hypothetical protein